MITLHFPHWNDISQYIKTAPLLEKNPSSFDAAVEAAEDASPRLFPNNHKPNSHITQDHDQYQLNKTVDSNKNNDSNANQNNHV